MRNSSGAESGSRGVAGCTRGASSSLGPLQCRQRPAKEADTRRTAKTVCSYKSGFSALGKGACSTAWRNASCECVKGQDFTPFCQPAAIYQPVFPVSELASARRTPWTTPSRTPTSSCSPLPGTASSVVVKAFLSLNIRPT